jgi:hypothetical protein
MSRRRRRRLVRTVVLGACLVLAVAALVIVTSRGTSGKVGGSARPPAATTTSSAPATTAPPSTTTTTDAGALPQTNTLPTGSSPQFQAEMNALWQGVVTGSVQAAMPAFFPEGAYVQTKSGGGNEADWQNRLVTAYSADIAAAHALLGAQAASAQLVSVNVPSQFAHWVAAGSCENVTGYYEVPNARLVYQVGGQVHSFGIASMISWRGEWYVVHLGAVERSGTGGQVDDPESGAGVSANVSTC